MAHQKFPPVDPRAELLQSPSPDHANRSPVLRGRYLRTGAEIPYHWCWNPRALDLLDQDVPPRDVVGRIAAEEKARRKPAV